MSCEITLFPFTWLCLKRKELKKKAFAFILELHKTYLIVMLIYPVHVLLAGELLTVLGPAFLYLPSLGRLVRLLSNCYCCNCFRRAMN